MIHFAKKTVLNLQGLLQRLQFNLSGETNIKKRLGFKKWKKNKVLKERFEILLIIRCEALTSSH